MVYGKNTKTYQFLIGVALLFCLMRFFAALPAFIKVSLLLFVGVGPCRNLFIKSFRLCKELAQPFLKSLLVVVSSGKEMVYKASAGYKRAANIMSAVQKMNDEEFEEKFGAFIRNDPAAPESSSPYAHSFVPESLCVRPVSEEEAVQIATAWWSEENEYGTGEDRLAELLSSIANKNPTKHTCLLNEYEELRLPVEVPVLSALIAILEENGIAADLTEDGQLIVSWGQSMDGLEAGQH